MATGNTNISLQSKFVFTLKTIATVFVTIASMLWGFHTFVLDKRLENLEEDIENVEGKIDKVYDHMIGIGGTNNDKVIKAESPIEEDKTKGSL